MSGDSQRADGVADSSVERGELVGVSSKAPRGGGISGGVGGDVAYGVDALDRVGDASEVLVRLHLVDRGDEAALWARAQGTVQASVPHGAFSGGEADGAAERVHKVGVVGVHCGGLVEDLHGAAEGGPPGNA